MSFSAVAGVFLKLPSLFLKICKWVLVRMALNCKLSSFKGRSFSYTKLKKKQLQGSCGDRKWRRKFLILWGLACVLVSLLVFSGLKGGEVSRKKEKVPDLWDEKARILQERFNVSKNQLLAMATLFEKSDQKTSLGCIERRGLRTQSSDGINRGLELLSSYWEVCEMQKTWVTEKVEAWDQCPLWDEYILEKPEVPPTWEKHGPVVLSKDTGSFFTNDQIHGMNVLQTRGPQNYSKEHCESLPICSLKIGWYVLIGFMVSWMVSGLRIILKRRQVQQQQQQLHSSSKGGGKWRRKLLILFLLSGMVGSMWLFWFISKITILWRTEMLANMCDERARMLQDQFNVSLNHVHALAILVSTFHHGKQPSAMDQKTFAEYTERTSFERPLTSGVAYALKVTHSEREQFEKQHGWTIKKMEAEDHSPVEDYHPEKLDPAPVQDEYAPVIFSQETVSHIVSIDMMSGKEDRENILRARASGKGVLTSPFKLLKSNHLGVVLTFAVYNTNLPPNATPKQRIAATEGYLGASYDVPSLVEKLLHQLSSKQTIVVNVYDTTNSSAHINMYGPNVTDTGLLHVSNLDFGDPVRRHQMHCRFKQKPPPPWTAIMASAAVLVITFLLGHIFHAAITKITKVEGDYCEMMELKVRAEAADVAKSQFLATVSHEIRTPMNGVLGMLQMLMDTDLNENQLDYARTAHASGQDLISLINEVLDQAKIESGRLELEAVQFDLRAVLDNALSLFSGKSHDKGIELAVYISDLVPEMVVGDPRRFRQIITNLVGNSVKFTEEGHIFVSVHVADEVRSPLEVKDKMLKQQTELINGAETSYNTLSGFPVVNRWKSWEKFKMLSSGSSIEATEMIRLLVTVEDTGVGIPRDAQSRIFMPFMQADSSTSRNYGGTGIGLSISKCLVDMMGGEIGFVSDPGTGSTFSFTAALEKGRIDSLDIKRHQFEPSVVEFRGLRGLVVDGSSVRAEITKYHLNRLGISVDIALSLESMSSYVSNARNASGKMLLDMVFIDKDGWNDETTLVLHRLLKELRLSVTEKPASIRPKIFLLATSSCTEIDKFKSSGLVDDVMIKPLRLSMLVTRFQQALGAGTKKHRNKEKPSFLQSLLSGKHILVVDDNVVNRRVAAGALKKYGAKVTCVESGKAAIGMLQPPHNFDACFMDLQMPEMDGFEATRQIRCIENEINEQTKTREAMNEVFGNVVHWHTPILAMTADVIQATHEKCMKCGMDGYVSKPFEEEQLYSAVMHFFEADR